MNLFDQLFNALIENGDLARAESILARHPTLLEEDGNGIALFDSAAHKGGIPLLEFLFTHGVDVNATLSPTLFHGPIVNAAMDGHPEAVKWLVAHGAEINPIYNGHRYSSALTSACVWGHLNCVQILVEHGAEINACWNGKNALSLAVEFGHTAIVKYLRSKGAKLPSEVGQDAPANKIPPKPKRKKS
jgi:ankyrin repeat protein